MNSGVPERAHHGNVDGESLEAKTCSNSESGSLMTNHFDLDKENCTKQTKGILWRTMWRRSTITDAIRTKTRSLRVKVTLLSNWRIFLAKLCVSGTPSSVSTRPDFIQSDTTYRARAANAATFVLPRTHVKIKLGSSDWLSVSVYNHQFMIEEQLHPNWMLYLEHKSENKPVVQRYLGFKFVPIVHARSDVIYIYI